MATYRHKNLFLFVLGCTLLVGAGASTSVEAGKITKCKDENGKWHYGDYAAQACTHSRITKMNGQGVKVEEQDAALSREEMRARREARERKKQAEKEIAAARARDRRLLMTYENVGSIEAARDARVEAVDRYLRNDQEFLKRLQDQLVRVHARLEAYPQNNKAQAELGVTEKQISAYEKSVGLREQERKRILDRFNADIDRYQNIKQAQETADNQILN